MKKNDMKKEKIIQNGIYLSPHFTLKELTKTSYMTADGNMPPQAAIENLTRLCQDWLEKLRMMYNLLYCLRIGENADTSENMERIVITSGYRSEEVNRRCGGAEGSNHLTGCAVDIRCAGREQLLRYATILLDLSDSLKSDFDELILEGRGTTYWLHFAVRPPSQRNRRKILFIVN